MKPRRSATASSLTPDLLRLMVEGPWSAGMNLLTMPQHERLRALWQTHEATIRAEAQRQGRKPWFVGRDRFVRFIETGRAGQ